MLTHVEIRDMDTDFYMKNLQRETTTQSGIYSPLPFGTFPRHIDILSKQAIQGRIWNVSTISISRTLYMQCINKMYFYHQEQQCINKYNNIHAHPPKEKKR